MKESINGSQYASIHDPKSYKQEYYQNSQIQMKCDEKGSYDTNTSSR